MKGTFYTIEAMIAIVIIVTSLAFVFSSEPKVLDLSKANYKKEAYEAIKMAEDVGDIRKNALANNATAIKNSLDPYISTSFDVAIFNRTSNTTAIPSVSVGNIIAVNYMLSGEVGNYTPHEVRVYMWGAG